MNPILLIPAEALFFRDGRPMEQSLAGHGAAWPLPHVINGAFHAALHRSGFAAKAHSHRTGSRGVYPDDNDRKQKFGSLKTAGPFPVDKAGTWFFPRPQDLRGESLVPALAPVLRTPGDSSLPVPLTAPVASLVPPSKEGNNPGQQPARFASPPCETHNAGEQGEITWYSQAAYEQYLRGVSPASAENQLLRDSQIFTAEQSIGIGIDPESQTTGFGPAQGKIYSAHYLRLRPDWKLGVGAGAIDKDFESEYGPDLVIALLNGEGKRIIVGGQQRVCSTECLTPGKLPLPRGLREFPLHNGKALVKWVLLSPAVWPEIAADTARSINPHPGGWLPNWVDPEKGAVLLKSPCAPRAEGERRDAWRARVRGQSGINARLVAALVPKPITVTGWALPHEITGQEGGAQSTHLAVPAGAVFYFEADDAQEAAKLASVLNWHGDGNGGTIINRRSTLLGEKGFGLGVCGAWRYWPDVPGRPKSS